MTDGACQIRDEILLFSLDIADCVNNGQGIWVILQVAVKECSTVFHLR